jgi:manganese-dependent inorganic pyrophosphatase
VGVFSRRDILRPSETRLILVDHNELSQAVPGAEEAEIVEVVDHHRLGDLRTQEPILFLNRPVGSTCTIVADLFRQEGLDVSPTLAGVLMGGLVSDTLNLRSPTTTRVDEEILRWLEARSGVTGSELAETIFSSGSVVAAQPAAEVVALDRKLYEEGRYRFAVSQVEELGFGEFWKQADRLAEALEASRAAENLDFAALFVTDVKSQDSLLMVEGDEEVIRQIPYPAVEEGEVFRLDGIVSRKKQLLPLLTGILRAKKE